MTENEEPEKILDLQSVFRRILQYWWLLILVTALGSAKGLWDMHNFSPSRIVKMTVAPVSGNQSQGYSREADLLSGGLGVLPQLAFGGVATEVTSFKRMLHAISTIGFARRLDEKFGLMTRIYGVSWDETNQTWRRPKGREFLVRERINMFLRLPLWSEPTIEDLAGYLGGLFQVNDVPNTNFKKITLHHSDPEFAFWLLQAVYDEATEYIREQDQRELAQETNYLEDRLNNTEIIELRQALVVMLANQSRKEMSLQKGFPFIARVIEPAYISKYTTSPNVIETVGLPTFVAFALVFGTLLVIVLFRNE